MISIAVITSWTAIEESGVLEGIRDEGRLTVRTAAILREAVFADRVDGICSKCISESSRK